MYEFWYWRRQNVRGPFPLPFFGNSLQLFGQTVYEFDYKNLKRFGHVYVDYLFPGTSFLCISDPVDVRQLLVSDFSKFSQRDDLSWPKYIRESIFFAHGARWKRLRSLLSPVFTASRLKALYPHMQIKGNVCVNNILDEIEHGRGRSICIKRLAKCTMIDVLVRVLMSIEINSFNSPSELSGNLGNFFEVHPLIALLTQVLPVSIQKLCHIHLINYSSLGKLVQVIKQMMAHRKAEPTKNYDDLLQMLMQAQQESQTADRPREIDRLSDTEVIAQSAAFFFVGIETSMSMMCKTLLQLALHLDWQDKLVDDLNRLYPDDDIPMERLQDSAILNAILAEVERDTFAVVRLLRMAAEDTTIAGVRIRKGQNVCVPLYNLHHDPSLYPSPMEFRPQRFLCPETEDFVATPSNLPDSAYIPFGDGPRKCVAYRFAQAELRLLLILIVRRFRVFITEHTQLPIKSKRMSLVNNFDEFKLGFQCRQLFTS